MAKKKKSKLSKAQRKLFRQIAIFTATAIISLLLGIVGTKLLSNRGTPRNVVWAADHTVVVPKDLRKFLLAQDTCQNYRGAKSPNGVGLWGVFQTSKKSYAKIAYGCSWNLTNYIMAIKASGTWQLIDPNTYFAPFTPSNTSGKGVLPYCTQVQQYKIPKDIESFCIKPDGTAEANTL